MYRVPRIVKICATFTVVSFAWVFFRSPTLKDAVAFFGNLFGFGHPSVQDSIAAGFIYQPYYVLAIVISCVVVWTGRQSWDFTRRLSWPVAISCVTVFCAAVLSLFTQSYSPFIYFVF